MADCRSVQDNLTAWIDGELPEHWDRRIRDHLVHCATCTAEAGSLRDAVQWQRRVLPAVTTAEGFEVAAIRSKLARALEHDGDIASPASSWRWRPPWLRMWQPAALMTAAAVVLLAVWVAGGPQAILIPLGIESPPVEVTQSPDLFTDYPLIEHLDALENFDTVESVPLEDDAGSKQG